MQNISFGAALGGGLALTSIVFLAVVTFDQAFKRRRTSLKLPYPILIPAVLIVSIFTSVISPHFASLIGTVFVGLFIIGALFYLTSFLAGKRKDG